MNIDRNNKSSNKLVNNANNPQFSRYASATPTAATNSHAHARTLAHQHDYKKNNVESKDDDRFPSHPTPSKSVLASSRATQSRGSTSPSVSAPAPGSVAVAVAEAAAATAAAVAAATAASTSALTPNNAYTVSIGQYIDIWWSKDKLFYRARVIGKFAHLQDAVRVMYDDGEKEDVNLAKELWKFASVHQTTPSIVAPPAPHRSPQPPSKSDPATGNNHEHQLFRHHQPSKPPKKTLADSRASYLTEFDSQATKSQTRLLKDKNDSIINDLLPQSSASPAHSSLPGGSPVDKPPPSTTTPDLNPATTPAPSPSAPATGKPRIRRTRRSSLLNSASEVRNHPPPSNSKTDVDESTDVKRDDHIADLQTLSSVEQGSVGQELRRKQQRRGSVGLASPSLNVRPARQRRTTRRSYSSKSNSTSRRASVESNNSASDQNPSSRLPVSTKKRSSPASVGKAIEVKPANDADHGKISNLTPNPSNQIKIPNSEIQTDCGYMLHIPLSSAPDLSDDENQSNKNGDKEPSDTSIQNHRHNSNRTVNGNGLSGVKTFDTANNIAGKVTKANTNISIAKINLTGDINLQNPNGTVEGNKVVEAIADTEFKPESLVERLQKKKTEMGLSIQAASTDKKKNLTSSPSQLRTSAGVMKAVHSNYATASALEVTEEKMVENGDTGDGESNSHSNQTGKLPSQTRGTTTRQSAKQNSERAINKGANTNTGPSPSSFHSIPLNLQLREDTSTRPSRNPRSNAAATDVVVTDEHILNNPPSSLPVGLSSGGTEMKMDNACSSALAAACAAAAAASFARQIADDTFGKSKGNANEEIGNGIPVSSEATNLDRKQIDADDKAKKESSDAKKNPPQDMEAIESTKLPDSIEHGPPRKRVRAGKAVSSRPSTKMNSPVTNGDSTSIASDGATTKNRGASSKNGAPGVSSGAIVKTRSNPPRRASTVRTRSDKGGTKIPVNEPLAVSSASVTLPSTNKVNGNTPAASAINSDDNLPNSTNGNDVSYDNKAKPNVSRLDKKLGETHGDDDVNSEKEDSVETDFQPVAGTLKTKHQRQEESTARNMTLDHDVTMHEDKPVIITEVSKLPVKRRRQSKRNTPQQHRGRGSQKIDDSSDGGGVARTKLASSSSDGPPSTTAAAAVTGGIAETLTSGDCVKSQVANKTTIDSVDGPNTNLPEHQSSSIAVDTPVVDDLDINLPEHQNTSIAVDTATAVDCDTPARKDDAVKSLEMAETLINRRIGPLSARLDKLNDTIGKMHVGVHSMKMLLGDNEKKMTEHDRGLSSSLERIDHHVSVQVRGIHQELAAVKKEILASNRSVMESVSSLQAVVEPSIKMWIQQAVGAALEKVQASYKPLASMSLGVPNGGDHGGDLIHNNAAAAAATTPEAINSVNDGNQGSMGFQMKKQENDNTSMPQMRSRLASVNDRPSAASVANKNVVNSRTASPTMNHGSVVTKSQNHGKAKVVGESEGAGRVGLLKTKNVHMRHLELSRLVEAGSSEPSNVPSCSVAAPVGTAAFKNIPATLVNSCNNSTINQLSTCPPPTADHKQDVNMMDRDAGAVNTAPADRASVTNPTAYNRAVSNANNSIADGTAGTRFVLYRLNSGFTTRVNNLVARQVTVTLLETPHERLNHDGGDISLHGWSKMTSAAIYSLTYQRLKQYASYAQAFHLLCASLGEDGEVSWFMRPGSQALLIRARSNYVAWDPQPSDEEWDEEMVLLKEVAEGYHRATDQFHVTTGMTELEVAAAVAQLAVGLYQSEGISADCLRDNQK